MKKNNNNIFSRLFSQLFSQLISQQKTSTRYPILWSIILCSFLTHTSLAASSDYREYRYNGFYLGAQYGEERLNLECDSPLNACIDAQSYKDFYRRPSPVNPSSEDSNYHFDFHGNGEHYSGLLGFGHVWGDYYLALESSAAISRAQKVFYCDTCTNTDKPIHYYIFDSHAVDIVPGLFITNTTMLYTKLGYTKATISAGEKWGDNLLNRPADHPDTGSINDIFTHILDSPGMDVNIQGYHIAAGISQAMSSHLDLRLEVSHKHYQKEFFEALQMSPSLTTISLGLVFL